MKHQVDDIIFITDGEFVDDDLFVDVNEGYDDVGDSNDVDPSDDLLEELKELKRLSRSFKLGAVGDKKKKKSSNGLTCKKCGDFYPYAEESNQEDGSFKCWGCRH